MRAEFKTNTGKVAVINEDVAKWEKKGKEAFIAATKGFWIGAFRASASEEKIVEVLGSLWDAAYPPKPETKDAPKKAE